MPQPEKEPIVVEIENAVLRYPLNGFERESIKTKLLHLSHRRGDAAFVEALSAVSLTVRGGERVGVIGSNGSGKSTLLRIIAGIYPLTSGSVRVQGNVSGLFDLGVGFVAEETGRRNIYYRGFLYGYTRREIGAIEADIVSFADLGEFIDRPIRTYSAGMQVRLAFAISTMLCSGVLLIDEIISAGDAAFALRAKQQVMRTIANAECLVLASHDMASVREICTRVIWLDRGRIKADGAPSDVTGEYERSVGT